MTFGSIRDVLFVQECICERIENQINFSNFQTCCLEVSFRGLKLEKNAHYPIFILFSYLEKEIEYYFIGSEHP